MAADWSASHLLGAVAHGARICAVLSGFAPSVGGYNQNLLNKEQNYCSPGRLVMVQETSIGL
jgi:hypothetical protein